MKRIFAALFVAALFTSAAHADILTTDGFEGSLGNWTASGGASLYTFSSGTNYASTGNGAADLPKSGGTITLTNALPLDSHGYTSLTLTFNYKWLNGTTTRFLTLSYSSDGTTYTDLGRVTSGNGGTGGNAGTVTVVLNEGMGNHTFVGGTILNSSYVPVFTDTAKFKFIDSASAGADVRAYVDNIQISATPDYVVPEPATLALFGIGGLMMIRRKRTA